MAQRPGARGYCFCHEPAGGGISERDEPEKLDAEGIVDPQHGEVL
ncbi:MAG: hypothetical protein ABW045_11675 [Gaiellaceae bacterium]|jgi:hypothetical protein